MKILVNKLHKFLVIMLLGTVSMLAMPIANAEEPVVGVAEDLNLEPHSAVVSKGFLCSVGSIGGFPTVLTTDSHSVISDKGNSSLICRGHLPAGSEPSKAVIQRGFLCGTFAGLTTDSQQVLTPSGEITLMCKVKV